MKPQQTSFDVSKYNDGPITFENRRSLIDDDFLGDRMPDRLGNGPVARRRMTDLICIIICGLFFVLFFILIFVYAFSGDYNLMKKPLDSDARICGEDDVVKDYPYLYLFKFDRNYKSVCVKSCPKFDYNQIKYNADGTNSSTIEPLYFEKYSTEVKRSILKGPGSDGESDSNFEYDPDFAAGYFTKEQYDTYRARYKVDCVTNTDVQTCGHDPAKGNNLYDSRPYSLNICFSLSPKIMTRMGFFGDISAGFYTDLRTASWMIFLSMIVALILGLGLLFLSSFFISWLIWVMIGIFIALCLLFGIGLWVVAFKDYSETMKSSDFKPYYVKKMAQLHSEKWQALLWGTILILVGALTGVATFFNIKSIKQAAAILKYSVSVLLKNVELIILGIICFLLQVLVFYLAVWIMVGIYTSGQMIKDSVVGEPIAQFRQGFWRWLLMIMISIATYWIICFINNFADFVTAATTVNHYFGKKPKFFGALKDTSVYHLGSVAIGSLVLAPVTVLQICFGWLFDLLTATGLEGEANAFQKIAGKVCVCFIYPYKKWILRVNEAGFAMVYLSSADFCPSSKEVYYLFLSYSNKIGKLDIVTNLYKFAVVLSISILNAWMFYGIFTYFDYYVKNIENPFLPAFYIFILTVLITIIFMNIYTTVCQTSILCYLIELDVGRVPRATDLHNLVQAAEFDGGKANNRYDPLK